MEVKGHDNQKEEEEEQTIEMNDSRNLPYPKSIFFIVVTEFCERFSYYGMRAVLTIYMKNVLNFSDDLSTTIYHVFLLLCYGLPVFGGILADSFIGKYKTIVYLSTVYALGNVVLTLASIQPLQLPVVPLSLTGLLLMAIGTGGIKPCVVALGGEQFVVPAQEKILKQFFAVFLFAVSIGNMVATVSTPVLRRDIACFGESTCYPLAFGVPGILMAVAISVFIGGRCLYKIKPPDENIFVRVIKCAVFAIKEKVQAKDDSEKKRHWLDYASSRYDERLINDTKGLFRVLIYYLPVPMFFALYEQLGSRWTLQATRMNGYISGGIMIKPDQMQVANAILLFIFIPVFETILYPVFRKCNLLQRPLQKMVIGGILASLSFVSAGIVETKIHSSYGVDYISSNSYLNFINTISCPVSIQEQGRDLPLHFTDEVANTTFRDFNKTLTISADGYRVSSPLPPLQPSLNLEIRLAEGCIPVGSKVSPLPWKGHVNLGHGLRSLVIGEREGQIGISSLAIPEVVTKSKEGNSKLRVIFNDLAAVDQNNSSRRVVGINVVKDSVVQYSELWNTSDSLSSPFVKFTNTFEVEPNAYQIGIIWINSDNVTVTTLLPSQFDLGTGGSYVITLSTYADSTTLDDDMKEIISTLTPENQVHMLWLLPQYLLIAWAEVLFIISGMEFSFTEAPASMKSVMQSCWHLANATGNAIVIISAQLNIIQMYEFFGFAALMGLDTLILCLMAIRYKYVDQGHSSAAIKRTNEEVEVVAESHF